MKAFHDISVERFVGDDGPMAAFKWIIHAERMVYMMDVVTMERSHWELVSHQMVKNTLAWWQGIEASNLEEALTTMTMIEVRTLFEPQYVLDTTRE